MSNMTETEVRTYFRRMPAPMPSHERAYHDGRFVVYDLWLHGKYQGVVGHYRLAEALEQAGHQVERLGVAMMVPVSSIAAQGRFGAYTFSRRPAGMTIREFLEHNDNRPVRL